MKRENRLAKKNLQLAQAMGKLYRDILKVATLMNKSEIQDAQDHSEQLLGAAGILLQWKTVVEEKEDL